MLDEKGRLFGKINVIDLLVALLVIVVAVVVAVKLLGGGEGLPGGETGSTKLTYTVEVDGVKPEVYENLKSYVEQEGGDQLMASGDMLDAYVTGVTAEPHEEAVSLNTANGQVSLPTESGLLDLTFTIESNVVNAVTNEVGTQEVRIGKTHTVKTIHFELMNGVITDCQWGDGE